MNRTNDTAEPLRRGLAVLALLAVSSRPFPLRTRNRTSPLRVDHSVSRRATVPITLGVGHTFEGGVEVTGNRLSYSLQSGQGQGRPVRREPPRQRPQSRRERSTGGRLPPGPLADRLAVAPRSRPTTHSFRQDRRPLHRAATRRDPVPDGYVQAEDGRRPLPPVDEPDHA